ncbi:hypothetical protein C0J52_11159 [Blattella germanica]|nr:hypothetical protein C0J52_11159 [Blattella germanica]
MRGTRRCAGSISNQDKNPIQPYHSAAFLLRLLLEYGADPNISFSRIRDCSTALHIAASEAHCQALKLLLKNPRTNPNTLNSKGKTPLYLAASSIKRFAKDADRKSEAEECFKVLAMHPERRGTKMAIEGSQFTVRNNIKTSIKCDLTEISAIGEAAKNGCRKDYLKLVMEHFKYLKTKDKELINPSDFPDINFDTYKDETTSITVLELFGFLEENNVQKFKDNVNDVVSDILSLETSLPNTLLQYACKKEELFPVVELLVKEVKVNLDSTGQSDNNPPLHIAALKGNHKALKLLIDNGAAATIVNQNTVLRNVMYGLGSHSKHDKERFRACFDYILENNTTLKIPINLGDLHGHTALHYAVLEEDPYYVKKLLDYGAYLGSVNAYGISPLHDIEPELLEEVLDNCIQRSKNDKYMSNAYTLEINLRNLNPLYSNCFHDDKITSTTETPPSLSNGKHKESYLITNPSFTDNFGENKHSPSADGTCTVQLDDNNDSRDQTNGEKHKSMSKPSEMHPLVNDLGQKSSGESRQKFIPRLPEMYPLFYISHSKKLRHLLTHPVLQIFLHLKWTRIYLAALLNIIFYVSFVSFLTAYLFSCKCEGIGFTTYKCSPNQTEILWYMVSILNVCLTAREVMQFAMLFKQMKMHYVFNLENWLEVGIIITTFAILSGYCSKFLMAVTFLLSWTEFLLLWSCFSKPSIYNEMLKKVTLNYLKFLLWFAPLIFAFTFSFYKLYHKEEGFDGEERNETIIAASNESDNSSSSAECEEDQDFFSDFSLSLLKTVVMMIGEFDASGMDFDHGSKIIFIFFVFMITIVLVNLLNGLAISDTQEIFLHAKTVTHSSRVKLLYTFENAIFGEPEKEGQSRSRLKVLQERIILFPDTISDDKLLISIKQSDTTSRYADPRNVKFETEYEPDKCFIIPIIRIRFGIEKELLETAKNIAERTEEKTINDRMQCLEEEMRDIKELLTQIGEKIKS